MRRYIQRHFFRSLLVMVVITASLSVGGRALAQAADGQTLSACLTPGGTLTNVTLSPTTPSTCVGTTRSITLAARWRWRRCGQHRHHRRLCGEHDRRHSDGSPRHYRLHLGGTRRDDDRCAPGGFELDNVPLGTWTLTTETRSMEPYCDINGCYAPLPMSCWGTITNVQLTAANQVLTVPGYEARPAFCHWIFPR